MSLFIRILVVFASPPHFFSSRILSLVRLSLPLVFATSAISSIAMAWTVAANETKATTVYRRTEAREAVTPAVPVEPSRLVTEKTVLKQFSLRELQGVADYLRVVAASPDHGQEKILNCDPEAKPIQLWLSGPMQELLDEKTEQEARSLKKTLTRGTKALQAATNSWPECAATCDCAADLLILDAVASKKADLVKLAATLRDEQKKQTPEQRLACAKKQDWFCFSTLKTYLETSQTVQR